MALNTYSPENIDVVVNEETDCLYVTYHSVDISTQLKQVDSLDSNRITKLRVYGNTWLLEIEENEELNEIMGINTENVYHDDIFRVRYWAHVSNGKELKITIDVNFDNMIEEHMTNLYREFETNIADNVCKYSRNKYSREDDNVVPIDAKDLQAIKVKAEEYIKKILEEEE